MDVRLCLLVVHEGQADEEVAGKLVLGAVPLKHVHHLTGSVGVAAQAEGDGEGRETEPDHPVQRSITSRSITRASSKPLDFNWRLVR